MKVYCGGCGDELHCFEEDDYMIVDPCGYCLDCEWGDGFNDGQYAEEHEGGN